MIAFLFFLVGTGLIAYAMALNSSRFLAQVFPDRMFVAALLAVLATLTALLVFYLVAGALIDVKAPSAEMGGLAWLLEMISYALALAVTIPCLVIGIARGLKTPGRETG